MLFFAFGTNLGEKQLALIRFDLSGGESLRGSKIILQDKLIFLTSYFSKQTGAWALFDN